LEIFKLVIPRERPKLQLNAFESAMRPFEPRDVLETSRTVIGTSECDKDSKNLIAELSGNS
jgi:hypothetical protein